MKLHRYGHSFILLTRLFSFTCHFYCWHIPKYKIIVFLKANVTTLGKKLWNIKINLKCYQIELLMHKIKILIIKLSKFDNNNNFLSSASFLNSLYLIFVILYKHSLSTEVSWEQNNFFTTSPSKGYCVWWCFHPVIIFFYSARGTEWKIGFSSLQLLDLNIWFILMI